MEIWRLATCGHGLQRSSVIYAQISVAALKYEDCTLKVVTGMSTLRPSVSYKVAPDCDQLWHSISKAPKQESELNELAGPYRHGHSNYLELSPSTW